MRMLSAFSYWSSFPAVPLFVCSSFEETNVVSTETDIKDRPDVSRESKMTPRLQSRERDHKLRPEDLLLKIQIHHVDRLLKRFRAPSALPRPLPRMWLYHGQET